MKQHILVKPNLLRKELLEDEKYKIEKWNCISGCGMRFVLYEKEKILKTSCYENQGWEKYIDVLLRELEK